jgi:hypothetical protein
LLNPCGYFFYTIYSLQGTIDNKIGSTGIIELNDLFFAIHGFCLSSFILMQVFLYDRGAYQAKIADWSIALLVFEWIIVLSSFFFEIFDTEKIA